MQEQSDILAHQLFHPPQVQNGEEMFARTHQCTSVTEGMLWNPLEFCAKQSSLGHLRRLVYSRQHNSSTILELLTQVRGLASGRRAGYASLLMRPNFTNPLRALEYP